MRSYIETLTARGDMLVVDREVDPRFELAAVVVRSQKQSRKPVLFRRVRGTRLPVVSNVFGSATRVRELIGAGAGSLCRAWNVALDRAADLTGRATRTVGAGSGWVAGTITDLPHIVWREKDAGPYISAGVFYAKDPDTGIGNLSFCRTQMTGDRELLCCIDAPHDLANYQKRAEARNEPLEVAILIAPPPEVFLAGCASVPIEVDEMTIAAAIRGEPIPVRSCESVSLEVPVETQIVIEGRIRPNERRTEGPFGEYLGFYGPVNLNGYVIDVSRVMWHQDAIFHGLLCGSAEDLTLLDVAFSSRTYRMLAAKLPGILDVTCNPMMYCSVVQIDKQYEGHAREAILETFAANTNYNFACVVVDKDVDITDFNEVFTAYLTRGRVDRRVLVMNDIRGWDRSSDPLYAGRIGIDATMPAGREAELERARTPGADSLKLADYINVGA